MTIMPGLNIKRFVSSEYPGRSIFMLIQLIRPENKEHLVGTATKDLALISQISEDRKLGSSKNVKAGERVASETEQFYGQRAVLG